MRERERETRRSRASDRTTRHNATQHHATQRRGATRSDPTRPDVPISVFVGRRGGPRSERAAAGDARRTSSRETAEGDTARLCVPGVNGPATSRKPRREWEQPPDVCAGHRKLLCQSEFFYQVSSSFFCKPPSLVRLWRPTLCRLCAPSRDSRRAVNGRR